MFISSNYITYIKLKSKLRQKYINLKKLKYAIFFCCYCLAKSFFLLWTHLRCNSSLVNAFDLWLRSLQFSQLSSPEVWTSNQPLRHSMFTRLGRLASPLNGQCQQISQDFDFTFKLIMSIYILMNDSSSIWDDTFT